MFVFNGDIKFFFFKEVSSVFEKCQFLVALFSFSKKITFYAKSISFWANVWITKYSDRIMSCKLWGKVRSVSVNVNFGAKMSILCKKKKKRKTIEILGEMLTFSLSVHYYWNWLCFCKICLFLEKCDLLCEGFYTLTVLNSYKNFNFLEYVNFYKLFWAISLKYFICWKIVILIQNIILCNDILGKSVISLVKSTLHLV